MKPAKLVYYVAIDEWQVIAKVFSKPEPVSRAKVKEEAVRHAESYGFRIAFEQRYENGQLISA